MPFRPGLKTEETTIAGNGLRRICLPRLAVNHQWDKGLKQFATGENGFTRVNAQRNALRPQAATALPFVDFGIDIQRRKQRVERTGRGVQHEGVVQAFVRAKTRLAANMVIFFVDLRGL